MRDEMEVTRGRWQSFDMQALWLLAFVDCLIFNVIANVPRVLSHQMRLQKVRQPNGGGGDGGFEELCNAKLLVTGETPFDRRILILSSQPCFPGNSLLFWRVNRWDFNFGEA